MNFVKQEFTFGKHTVSLETGELARQASSVKATMENTVVLATVVGDKTVKSDQDFFPLSIHYQEKYYAAGKIPGGFLKREGRPSEKEILTSRLIDRPIRPLFPKGFMNEVQIVLTVLSVDKKHDPDILSMIAASAALSISGLPFQGPFAGARVGFHEDKGYILNPSYDELETSELDMVVAGTTDAVLMVESAAQELSEDEMLGAILFAQQQFQCVIDAIQSFSKQVDTRVWDWQPVKVSDVLIEKIVHYKNEVHQAYQITDKQDRCEALRVLKTKVLESLVGTEEQGLFKKSSVEKAFNNLEKIVVRGNIIGGLPRIDGRDTKTVRDIQAEIDVLPKTHGSAVFTRGETQALVTTTFGTLRDAQIIETLEKEIKDPFILHYNFPPYSVGECGRLGIPGRREIGHGRLVRRGIQAVLPDFKTFPYCIRVVSEITESNGSSSMASVCGTSLALMDAGVPLTSPVAGIAMGLVKEGDDFVVLTDILGDEDHLGDMDFKVAGTSEGVTTLQMDIKIKGITEEIMEVALEQALQARLHILEKMNRVISESRAELNKNAPVTKTIKIDPNKIRDVIGKGGAMIRSICEETGATVDIDDNGLVKIFADERVKVDAAYQKVQGITADAEIGSVYVGKVTKIMEFGAFVNILPGKDGLVHISQISVEKVEKASDFLSFGQEVKVKVTDIDSRGRIKLSMKEAAN